LESETCRKMRTFLVVPFATYDLVAITDNIAAKNSPSRVRFRPPVRLTFRFRVRPPGLASSYSRPVLGATGTLGDLPSDRKSIRARISRNLRRSGRRLRPAGEVGRRAAISLPARAGQQPRGRAPVPRPRAPRCRARDNDPRPLPRRARGRGVRPPARGRMGARAPPDVRRLPRARARQVRRRVSAAPWSAHSAGRDRDRARPAAASGHAAPAGALTTRRCAPYPRAGRGTRTKEDGRSSPGWTRTNNPPVNSRMLCQLSYRGTARAV
jgi:hypothetical protein